MTPNRVPLLAIALWLCWCITACGNEGPSIEAQPSSAKQTHDSTDLKDAADKACPWGEPVDGIACRIVVQPRYVVGQPITAAIEVKNVSKRKRYLLQYLDPSYTQYVSLRISGPKGKLSPSMSAGLGLSESAFRCLDVGEIQRFEIPDLLWYFGNLAPWLRHEHRHAGRYALQLRFRSPRIPARFETQSGSSQETPPEMVASQWAHEVASPAISFELLPLTDKELLIHEWGVFTVFNDVKDANSGRKKEWGNLPSFFYRQYPEERLRWIPAYWNKPIVYFYAKQTPMQLRVNVRFAEGVPVVWWPAVADPVDEGQRPNSGQVNKPRPYRSLTWDFYLGQSTPDHEHRFHPHQPAWLPVKDFGLPTDCWLQETRLPDATPLTVVGNGADGRGAAMPGMLDRQETERFLFYDGLVPTPDYLRCEKLDGNSVTLGNRAKFDLWQLFLVDRRTPRQVGFACRERKHTTFQAGTTLTMPFRQISAEDWPQAGLKQVKQALLDAGLFEAEIDALLKIWRSDFFETDGITLFYILPQAEYDHMLPLTITPAPAGKPTRVGIALHPHVEREPELAARVAALLPDLDDPSFAKRAAASKALLEIGPFAARVLRSELRQSPSAEQKRRIEEVLQRLDAAEIQNIPGPAEKK